MGNGRTASGRHRCRAGGSGDPQGAGRPGRARRLLRRRSSTGWAVAARRAQFRRLSHAAPQHQQRRTEFADLPMPDEWPDYPSHAHILEYLTDYASRFDLLRHIHPQTTVESVRRAPMGGWAVTVRGADHRSSFEAPAVVVASGHNSVPRWPSPPWPDLTAAQLHSHDYRDPAQLAGKRVLVSVAATRRWTSPPTPPRSRPGPCCHCVGASGSCRSTCSAAPRTPSTGRSRSGCPGGSARDQPDHAAARGGAPGPLRPADPDARVPAGPSDALRRAALAHRPRRADCARRHLTAAGSRVAFVDGLSEEFDLVVWCTGYTVDLPFLDAAVDGRGNGPPLYRNVFSLEEPALFFVGLMQSTGAALPIVEAQARLVGAFLSGTYALPDPTVQRADRAERLGAARAGGAPGVPRCGSTSTPTSPPLRRNCVPVRCGVSAARGLRGDDRAEVSTRSHHGCQRHDRPCAHRRLHGWRCFRRRARPAPRGRGTGAATSPTPPRCRCRWRPRSPGSAGSTCW